MQIIIEIYPRNYEKYKKFLPSNIIVYNFMPSFVSILNNCGIDFMFPVFESLIANNVTTADKTIGYLLDSIRIFIENLNFFPKYLHYLKNIVKIDLQLEMLYRSVFEHSGVPLEKLESVKDINSMFCNK